MSPGYFVTLAVIFGFGLLAIVSVAWTARIRDREELRELEAPPPDPIPGLAPDAPAPEYLTELRLRDTPAGAVATDLSDADRERLRGWLPDAVGVPIGYLDGDFVTDRATQWAVLDRPGVVWCPEGIGSTRELISLVGAIGPDADDRPALVLLAPTWQGDVVEHLLVNVRRRNLRAVPLVAEPGEAVDCLLAVTGQLALSRSQLLADYVPADAIGRVERWVAASDRSWVFPPMPATTPGGPSAGS